MLPSAIDNWFLSDSIISNIISLGKVATSRSLLEILFRALIVSNRHHFDNDRKLVLRNLHKLTNSLNQQPPLSFRTINSRNPIGFGHLQKLEYQLQVFQNTLPDKLMFGMWPHKNRGLGKNVEAWWCLECIERQLHQQGYSSTFIEQRLPPSPPPSLPFLASRSPPLHDRMTTAFRSLSACRRPKPAKK